MCHSSCWRMNFRLHFLFTSFVFFLFCFTLLACSFNCGSKFTRKAWIKYSRQFPSPLFDCRSSRDFEKYKNKKYSKGRNSIFSMLPSGRSQKVFGEMDEWRLQKRENIKIFIQNSFEHSHKFTQKISSLNMYARKIMHSFWNICCFCRKETTLAQIRSMKWFNYRIYGTKTTKVVLSLSEKAKFSSFTYASVAPSLLHSFAVISFGGTQWKHFDVILMFVFFQRCDKKESLLFSHFSAWKYRITHIHIW